jgi:radical SAM protein with 4Fe4S-binding SPASM domain
MYYTLKKMTRLVREKACVVLLAADNPGHLRYVHPVYAILLASCDGRRDEAALLRRLVDDLAFTPERAQELLARVLRDVAPFLETSPEPADRPNRYDPFAFLYHPEGDHRLRRLSAPVEVAWLMTQRCPCDCAYCCIRTLPAHPIPAGELTTEQAFRFLEDCVASGVQCVKLHGGEPFLRRDLPELAAWLLGRGVHVSVSTKMRLTESVVARLAAAGMEEMQVSLDAVDAATADALVGRRGALRTAVHNIRLLASHGIAPRVNTVVTSRSLAGVPELVRRMAALGVRRISLSGYIRSLWKHDDSLLPEPAALRAMAEAVERTAAGLPGVEVQMCPLADPRDVSLSKPGFSSCAGGRSGLAVGPDGSASICDRLLPIPAAVVGNVTRSTLREIWDGDAMRAFVDPPADAYGETACGACGLREACNRRVRCYYRSLIVTGKLFAPDYLCPVVPAPEERFF